MADPRIESFARILVEYSTQIEKDDRVFIEATTEAVPLVSELYKQIFQRGGHPYLQMTIPEQLDLLYRFGDMEQARHTNELMAHAYENFEARIRIWSQVNTKALGNADASKQTAHAKGQSDILKDQFERGAAGKFKWVTTLFPTHAYAQQAGMSLEEYQDFVYKAVHALEKDPVAYWQNLEKQQEKYLRAFAGHDKVQLRGPNVDLSLSIKERNWRNSHGLRNMPDGEIFTGPVEDSANGWVRFTYPAIINSVEVDGVELHFKEGKVERATARVQEGFLKQMLATDEGASRVGEFAIGLNTDIDRFTGDILFDEKIGGSFHMALGAGYPETGSQNKSAIHWDMICAPIQRLRWMRIWFIKTAAL
ncbi:MAG: aminopeptidase [Anaerolineales bacterium]